MNTMEVSRSSVFVALIAVGILLVGLIAGLYAKDSSPPLGSVTQGNEYNSTTTRSTSAGTHWVAKTTTNGGMCALGSIVVASSSATTLTIWNATSTTDSASTTIATLKAGVAEGTYTFDAVCTRGVVVATPASFNGMYVVTWR